MGAHGNIKADKAAITKRRIYPPNLSTWFSNGQIGQLLRKSRVISSGLQISLFGSFPKGPAGKYGELRIQIAAVGVNSLAK
jgi:hypothetical protein